MKKILSFACFLTIFNLFLSCQVVNLLDEHQGAFHEGSLLFNPNLPGNCPPPAKVQLGFKNQSPFLSWEANSYADYYQIYRKGQFDKEFKLVGDGQKVLSLEFHDTEVVKGQQSGLYQYQVVSIDKFGVAGYRSNPVGILLSNSEIPQKLASLTASQGCFNSNTDLGIVQNKLGILLMATVSENINFNDFNFIILRQEEGTSTTEVIDDQFKATSSTFTYIDVPPKQGVNYHYTFAFKNVEGKVGQPMRTEKAGFVFPIPQIVSLDPYQKDLAGNPTGFFKLTVTPLPNLKGIHLYAAENAREPFKIYTPPKSNGNTFLTINEKGVISNELDAQALLSIMNKTHFGKFLFCITGLYQAEDGSEYETIQSDALSSYVYTAQGANFEYPKVTATIGSATNPIKLSWRHNQKSSITEYKIYRVQQLHYSLGDDKTEWGEPIDSFPISEQTGEIIEWEDAQTNSLRFGPYIYKVNPCIDKQENDNSEALESFVFTCKGFEGVTLSSTSREFYDKINLSWNALNENFYNNNAFGYQIEFKHPNAIEWEVEPYEVSWKPLQNNPEVLYSYHTDILGPFKARVAASVQFLNNGAVCKRVLASPLSNEVETGIEITDLRWSLFFMDQWLKAQALIKPTLRDDSQAINGGIYLKEGAVDFKRRSYADIWCSNEKYDVYRLTDYPTVNKAMVINGVIYHLYYNFNSTNSNNINLSFSSSDFTVDHGSNDDKIPKKQGEIIVSGFYPGKVQLWFENNGYEFRNDALGLNIVNDFTPGRLYVNTGKQNENIDWFADSYGLMVRKTDSPAIHKEHAVSILRDEKTEWTHISASETLNAHLGGN